METIAFILLGGIITIVFDIWVSINRKPELEFRIADHHDRQYERRPAREARFLALELKNKPLPPWKRWMSRYAALQSYGYITFHHLDGQDVFGRAMPIRWSGTIEPITTDPVLYFLTTKRNIYPDETLRLDVAARFDNENECYGWTDSNYFSDPQWRNPEWRLDRGRYLVNVTINHSGERFVGLFRLINDVPQNDFRLVQATQEDFENIRGWNNNIQDNTVT